MLAAGCYILFNLVFFYFFGLPLLKYGINDVLSK